jgi:hypothetical protein
METSVLSQQLLRRLALAGLGLALTWSGCSKNEIPEGEEVPVVGNPGQMAHRQSGPTFTVPEGWIEEAPSSSMRQAQYRLPGDQAGDAELAIFTGIGGSVQQNVERWINQFTVDGQPAGDRAEITTRQVSGYNVTFVDVSGAYSAATMAPMMGGGSGQEAKPGYRMLAAVIETSSGPWFLKLTGPEETVGRWESSFEEYVASVR